MNYKTHTLKNHLSFFIMYVLFALFLLLILPNLLSAAEKQAPIQKSIKLNMNTIELQAFIDSLIQQKMEEHHIPGVQFILVKDGEVFFAKGYGYADLENKIPVDPERTLYRICSIAKVVTGTAVMQLVEQGKIDLNKDINDYLSLFKVKNKFPQPVTMNHLLTHTAGFDDMYLKKVGRTPEEQMPLGEFLAKRLPPVITPPGEISTYSNLGNALAGYLVEVISQQDFADYAAEHIFKPLEMTRSSFRLPDSLAPDLVNGYFYKNGKYQNMPFDYLNDYPAGQMVSTATDMAKFMIAHLQNGRYKDRQILKESTIKQMHSPQFKHHLKLHGDMGHTFAIGAVQGHRLLEHNGGYIGAATRLWLLPDLNIGIYVACNTMNSQLNYDVTNQLAERYFPKIKKDTTTFPIENLPPYDADVDRFVGTYRFTRYTHRSMTKTGVLFGMIAPELSIWQNDEGMILMKDWHGKPRRMIQVEPLLFQSIDDDYYCAFRQNNDGKITHLFTHGTTAFEKVPWYYTLPFQRTFFFACFAILLLAALKIAIQFVIRKIKKKKVARTVIQNRLHWLTWLSSFTLLFYLLAFGVTLLLIPEQEALVGFGYGLPKVISLIQVIPFVGIIFLLVMLFYLIKSWAKQDVGIFKKILYSLVILAGIGFIWFLNYWNLLGWRF